MSLYSRRILLALPLALAACGFTPVYGPDGAGSKLRGQVLVQEPSTQAGYLLTRHLETRLGRSGASARYGLDKVLSFDMGGTTARLSLINGFRPQMSRKFEASRAAGL